MAVIVIPPNGVDIVGDAVTVSGTVDGVPVTVTVWLSHLQTLATKALKAAYVAQVMKAAVPAHTTTDLSGTYNV